MCGLLKREKDTPAFAWAKAYTARVTLPICLVAEILMMIMMIKVIQSIIADMNCIQKNLRTMRRLSI